MYVLETLVGQFDCAKIIVFGAMNRALFKCHVFFPDSTFPRPIFSNY